MALTGRLAVCHAGTGRSASGRTAAATRLLSGKGEGPSKQLAGGAGGGREEGQLRPALKPDPAPPASRRYLQWVKDADTPAYRSALRRCLAALPLEQYRGDARYLRVWVKYVR